MLLQVLVFVDRKSLCQVLKYLPRVPVVAVLTMDIDTTTGSWQHFPPFRTHIFQGTEMQLRSRKLRSLEEGRQKGPVFKA
jgi:hypothetical protein